MLFCFLSSERRWDPRGMWWWRDAVNRRESVAATGVGYRGCRVSQNSEGIRQILGGGIWLIDWVLDNLPAK